jgi:hypothetical protein
VAAVTAGHNYTLTLTNHDDNFAGDASVALPARTARQVAVAAPSRPAAGTGDDLWIRGDEWLPRLAR